MGMRKGFKITMVSGATKIVFQKDIDKGRSLNPLHYYGNETTRKDLIAKIEEGDFNEVKPDV